MTAPKNLSELLEYTAFNAPDKGVIIYPPGQTDQPAPKLLYSDLLLQAQRNAYTLQQTCNLKPQSVVLSCFDSHSDGLKWLWSVIAAGMIPCVCGPMNSDLAARKKHLEHLHQSLDQALCLTLRKLLGEFSCQDVLNIKAVEDLQYLMAPSPAAAAPSTAYHTSDDIAALMLTSGSTGNSKAVILQHGQILQAVPGKSLHRNTVSSDIFLNWIGLDHVANLTEIHLHAMFLGANQIHIQAADLLSKPLLFLDLISKHSVSYTFSPNFFLSKLERSLLTSEGSYSIDLRSLRALISGSEANPVETISALSRELRQFGAPEAVIRPGFEMTETCAGSIYSLQSPRYDLENLLEFASLSTCIPGIQMRITSDDDELAILPDGETGNLQVRGSIITTGYYNNEKATLGAFTVDGWFKTGDGAFIGLVGMLVMTGRQKESIVINGVHHYPHELETAVEEAAIPGVTDGYTVVFPFRRRNSPTEDTCVVFLPT